MPELPEVETIVRGLKKSLVNQKILEVKIHNKCAGDIDYLKIFEQQTIKDIVRYGKYGFFSFLDTNKILGFHLRMTGQIFVKKLDFKIDKHSHLEIYFREQKLVFRDIRKFGGFFVIENLVNFVKSKNLGYDALNILETDFITKISSKNKAIKTALLDQSVIAGIGNIYADEILIRAKIRPDRLANSLSQKELRTVFKFIKIVLNEAILKEGTSFSDYVNSFGNKGKFQLSLKAYKQENKPCSFCSNKIEKMKINGRTTRFCRHCQK